jgi:serine/threonine protein kinase/beta-lactam-binding protein with PASTA domain
MIKIGMVIGDRYEIIEKIGTGGMSDVYKAKDNTLDRCVAVKVLKQEFSENANFVSKFRIEAKAAAGLMHPNIVNVYDVGSENGIYYIIMELVEGITLKKYIEKKSRLSVKEAVSIAIQVSMGIEAAHNAGIIHRDIKPQNIIISREGKVKVTDFGIAKAATSNTISSNVMGSVHYTSPEQARGGYSDARSDIYSLGITMFEMLTGRVPFNGDTTVAIAIKHIQEELPPMHEIVPDIPVSVEQIVDKCCQKNPDRRYQSVGELIIDLKKSLMDPDGDFVRKIDDDNIGPTRTVTNEEISHISHQPRKHEATNDTMRLRDADRRKYEEEYEDYPEETEEEDYDPKKEHLKTAIAIIAAVVLGLLVVFFIGRAFGIFSTSGGNADDLSLASGETAVVLDDLSGRKADDAKKILIDDGLTPQIEYAESSKSEGTVIGTKPEAGTKVASGSTVVLTVSEGDSGIKIPDVTGKTQAEAKSALEQKGFTVTVVSSSDDSGVKAGCVVSQSPKGGGSAPAGSEITITISSGDDSSKIKVPNVIGSTEEEAMVKLTEAGLTLGTVTEVNNDDNSLKGLVCAQSYQVGTYVDKGTVVDLKVSTGAKAATYTYSGNVAAPTEEASYKSGMSVNVTLTAADGTQLYNSAATAFPLSLPVITGITSPTGVLTLTFAVTTEATTTTDANGQTVTVPASTANKTVTRTVTFTQEQN